MSQLILLQGVLAVAVMGVLSLPVCRHHFEKHHPMTWRLSHIAMSIVILLSLTWPSTRTMRILNVVAACFLGLELFIAITRSSTTGRLASLDKGPGYIYVAHKSGEVIPDSYHRSFWFYWIQGEPVQAWYSKSKNQTLVYYHPGADSTAFFEGPFGPNCGPLSFLTRFIRSKLSLTPAGKPSNQPKKPLNIWSDESGWWRAFALYEDYSRLNHEVSLYVVVRGKQTARWLQTFWDQASEHPESGSQVAEKLDVMAAIKTSSCYDIGK